MWLRDRLRAWLCPELLDLRELSPEEVEEMVMAQRTEEWRRQAMVAHLESLWQNIRETLDRPDSRLH